MSKRSMITVGLLVLVALAMARSLMPSGGIADFPDHMMLALEAAVEERSSSGGEMRHVTIWSQQEGLDLVQFEQRRGGDFAILREEQGQVEVLAMLTWGAEDNPPLGATTMRRLPWAWGWHVRELNMMVTGFEHSRKFYRVEALYYVEGQTKRVEYDVPDGATQGMVFARYEHSPPGVATVFFYDQQGNQIGRTP